MFHWLKVLCPRGRLGPKVTSVIQHHCLGVIKDNLTPGSEFWDSTKTLKHLLESSYFVVEEKDEEEGEGGVFRWPEVLKSMLADGELQEDVLNDRLSFSLVWVPELNQYVFPTDAIPILPCVPGSLERF